MTISSLKDLTPEIFLEYVAGMLDYACKAYEQYINDGRIFQAYACELMHWYNSDDLADACGMMLFFLIKQKGETSEITKLKKAIGNFHKTFVFDEEHDFEYYDQLDFKVMIAKSIVHDYREEIKETEYRLKRMKEICNWIEENSKIIDIANPESPGMAVIDDVETELEYRYSQLYKFCEDISRRMVHLQEWKDPQPVVSEICLLSMFELVSSLENFI